jgi:hypothetical protein
MPILSNPKHERFAQAISNGKTLEKAYEEAGYKPSKSNGSQLKQRTDVSERINEILTQSCARLVENVDYSREKILAEIEEARMMALNLEMPGAAWQAAIAKARILGLIIDRREVGDAGAFDAMTDEELVREATKKAQELGVPHLKLVDDDSAA